MKLTKSIRLPSMQLQNSERDFKSEKFFRTCFVADNPVTSLEFLPIRCATMLCHFGHTRNGSIATHFILFSSTTMSSATGDLVAVPERFIQNEEPASGNEERTRNQPTPAPKLYAE